MNIYGNCVVCGRYLGIRQYDELQVVALLGPEGTIVCCVEHLDGGPKNPRYAEAIEKLTMAKIAQFQAN